MILNSESCVAYQGAVSTEMNIYAVCLTGYFTTMITKARNSTALINFTNLFLICSLYSTEEPNRNHLLLSLGSRMVQRPCAPGGSFFCWEVLELVEIYTRWGLSGGFRQLGPGPGDSYGEHTLLSPIAQGFVPLCPPCYDLLSSPNLDPMQTMR